MYYVNYIELDKYQNVSRQTHEGILLDGGSLSHLQSFTGSGWRRRQAVCRARLGPVMICGSDRRIIEQLGLPPKDVKTLIHLIRGANHLSQFDTPGLAAR
jgi:hypothetical protein